MLTARGFWLLLMTLILLGMSVWLNVSALALVCLTVLLWLLAAWLWFAVQIRVLTGRLRVQRRVGNQGGRVQSLWAGQKYQVRVRLHSQGLLPTPYLRASDRVPFASRHLTGDTFAEGRLAAERALDIAYDISCLAPGVLRFEGVSVQAADLQGLFYHDFFLQDVKEHRVLPPLADARGRLPAVKRYNVIPLLGTNRLRRPGSGSELLDLRDYLPGDPPRTIAWKISARRGRLMTKEFESEIPVRSTLFLDTSQSVRVGSPWESGLTRLVEISACVAQASAAVRDLTGLCVFDDREVTLVRPARGHRHLIKLLGMLAEVAGMQPTSGKVAVEAVLPLAYALARETYPELLHEDVNAFPAWLPWLSPQPAWTLRRPRWRARAWLRRPGIWFRLLLRRWRESLGQAVAARFSAQGRLRYRWRKKLAALLSVRYGIGPAGPALLLEDDERFVLAMQRFLAEHRVPYLLPLYDLEGRYLFAEPAKVGVLSRALLHAVARGRDNELFVLLTDLLEIEDQLGPLLKAVKIALARHHQVLVVCPWPMGVPMPETKTSEVLKTSEVSSSGRLRSRLAMGPLIATTATQGLHQAFHRLQLSFGRLGVPVLCAQQEDSVRLILNKLDRLRAQQRGVR
jgi:uncharacterized protein (DUF58 family)